MTTDLTVLLCARSQAHHHQSADSSFFFCFCWLSAAYRAGAGSSGQASEESLLLVVLWYLGYVFLLIENVTDYQVPLVSTAAAVVLVQ